MGTRNRTAGNGWERECVNILKERGIYPEAMTTRFGNRSRDHQDKIDIMNNNEHTVGIMTDSIQAKNTVDSVNYAKLLESMGNIPGTRKVIFHKRTRKAGTKFLEVGRYALMNLSDYVDLLAAWKASKLIPNLLDQLPVTTQEEVKRKLTELGIPF